VPFDPRRALALEAVAFAFARIAYCVSRFMRTLLLPIGAFLVLIVHLSLIEECLPAVGSKPRIVYIEEPSKVK
jgi:hypothetical protein